jgi:hypothetical protein
MAAKVLFLISALVFFVSCRNAGETVVDGQTRVETNINTLRRDAESSRPKTKNKTFAKAFVTSEELGSDSREIVYTEHLIEFIDENSKGISIYVDNKKKTFLKIETNHPKIRTDFLESNGERFFVLVAGSAGFGSCADAIFAIVKLNEKLDVNISKPNEPDCQGESYDVKIENVSNKNDFYRQITVGSLKFNLKSFDWYKDFKK